MNKVKYSKLPLIGRVQHGEQVPTTNGGKRAKELGHFIAKIKDDYMQGFLNKFNEQYMGKRYIEIEFCNDNPLSKKFERNNQGGKACYCIEGNTTGKQKTKDGWKPIECSKQCQYRQKDKQGKSACNRIGWLKFLIPSICQNRIWLMRITGQESINRIDAFINLEKAQENTLKGHYILFLKQEEQTSKATGKSYNNYILDIVKKEDFISKSQIPQNNQIQEELSTKRTQNENNNVEKETQNTVTKPITTQKSNMEAKNTQPKEDNKQIQNETKETAKPKRQTKSKTKKAEEKSKETTTKELQETENFDNYYVFASLSSKKIQTESGLKEYTIGQFYTMQENEPQNIIVKPEYAQELQNCELGTVVEITEIKKIEDLKFALDLKFIEKREKNIAA